MAEDVGKLWDLSSFAYLIKVCANARRPLERSNAIAGYLGLSARRLLATFAEHQTHRSNCSCS